MYADVYRNAIVFNLAGQWKCRSLVLARADRDERLAIQSCRVVVLLGMGNAVAFRDLETDTLYDISSMDLDEPDQWHVQLRTLAEPGCARFVLEGVNGELRPVLLKPAPWNNQPSDPDAPTGGLARSSDAGWTTWNPEVSTGLSLGAPEPAPEHSVWNTPIRGAVWTDADKAADDDWRTKYEYKIIEFFSGWTMQQLLEELNALGRQGWELVSRDATQMTFKRELDE